MPESPASRYYDALAEGKIRDYVIANPRLERAWRTVLRWAGRPARILELGCGAGSICWRLARRFPRAEVVGVDFSPGNLKLAERYFLAPNLRYVLSSVDEDLDLGRFDLVILMDVYEHVKVEERPRLHANLLRSLSERGVVIVTVPTPRRQEWLRARSPGDMQPVDESISPQVLCALASGIERELLAYEEVDVWHRGDYAHAVLGRSAFPEVVRTSLTARLRSACLGLVRAARIRARG